MKSPKRIMMLLDLLFAVMMSIPFLVPHMGWVSLFGIVPLLCMDYLADSNHVKGYWWWHYVPFVLWNAFTTWWVCNATVGGGIFAVLANALQMSLVFTLFHYSKRLLKGVLPYIFLAALWITWERAYFDFQISWPWLTLGNSFARTLSLAQWYEYTGTLGGSLWIWACNLGLFGLLVSIAEGRWINVWNNRQRIAAFVGYAVVLVGPVIVSEVIYNTYEEKSEGVIDVCIGQPNIDQETKRQLESQSQCNMILKQILASGVKDRAYNDSVKTPLLFLAPETFTSDIALGDRLPYSRTYNEMIDFLLPYKDANIIYGASTYEFYKTRKKPFPTVRATESGWVQSRNSALLSDITGRTDICHKGKLVVGTESTPWPEVLTKLDDKLGGVMGRCQGFKEPYLLRFRTYNPDKTIKQEIPIGCAICYESVYPEYCTWYTRKGAKAMTVITNDSWWGDTPGYRQHLSYSSLRAIELRRDIARCANTGISAFIDQRGRILERSHWMQPEYLRSTINLNSKLTFFAAHGDMAGRVCNLVCLLLVLAAVANIFIKRK